MDEGLTRDEIALVLRRAAELDRLADPEPLRLSAAAVGDAAAEAGISRHAFGRALAELRVGALTPAPAPRTDRLLGPRTVTVRRVVPGPHAAVKSDIDRFLRRQLFRVVRFDDEATRWWRAEGFSARLERRLNRLTRHLSLDGVGQVDSVVTDDGEQVMVQLTAVVDRHRATPSVVAGGVVGAGVLGGGVAVLGVHPVALVAAVPAAAAVAIGARLGSSAHRHEVARLETALEGLLDRLARRKPRRQSRL